MPLTIDSDVRAIARAYEDAIGATTASVPVPVQRAYWTLERYVNLRWQDALDDGWRFLRTTAGAEPDSTMLGVAWATRTLQVYDRHHDHPAWSDETNYRFRAVHDVYGHIPQGDAAPFTYAGELAAARQQARDITRAAWRLDIDHESPRRAIQAAFTEIIGQAAYFEVHGKFPAQKAALLFSADVR